MNRPIFWIAVSLSIGIAVARYGALPVFPFLLLSLLFTALAWRVNARGESVGRTARFFWSSLCAAVFALGPALVARPEPEIADLRDGPLTVSGTVATFPIAVSIPNETARVRYVFETDRVLLGDVWEPRILRLQVRSVPLGREVYRGARLKLSGTLLLPQGLRNPGGFNAKAYFENQNVAGLMLLKSESDCFVISDPPGWTGRWIRALQDFRSAIVAQLDRTMTYPENAVMKAVLLGDQFEISLDLRDAFAKSGTSHLLAISGGNIAVIAGILMGCFAAFRCPRRTACAITLGLLWIYCLLTGGAPSIVRATIMVSIVLSGILLRREPEAVTSLSWAAIFILAADPYQLFDLGFQLSFITVLWMVTLLVDDEPAPAGRRSRFSRLLTNLRQNFRLSFFAWLATLPHTSRIFYLATPIAVVANLFVVPYFGLVMAAGLCILGFGWMHPAIADLLGLAATFFTRGFIWMSNLFAAIPGGAVRVAPLPLWMIGIYYLFYAAWVLRREISLRPAVWRLGVLFFINLIVWKPVLPAFARQSAARIDPARKLTVTFLDVGHGDAAVVRFPSGKALLVDAGDGGRSDMGRRVVAPYLWSHGITRIDAVVISHPHLDHYGGLFYLMDEFPIGRVWDNGDPRAASYNAIFSRAGRRAPPRETLLEGDHLILDPDVRVRVLHPSRDVMNDPSADPNNQSVVLQVVYGRFAILLTGDAEEPAQARLGAMGRELKCFLLKVPHHGSDEKSSADFFLAAARPMIAVISEAERNKFRLPGPGTLRRLEVCGAKIFQTGFYGAVEFETDGENYELRTMTDN